MNVFNGNFDALNNNEATGITAIANDIIYNGFGLVTSGKFKGVRLQ